MSPEPLSPEPLSPAELRSEIETAEDALADIGVRERRLWDRIRIRPCKWAQNQYPDVGDVWVVALMGRRCLYHNHVEMAWGWGRYDEWGVVSEYHWQQDDIQHVVYFTLFAIDQGGSG